MPELPSLVVVQGKATQFDGPFFRYFHSRGIARLAVHYTDSDCAIRPYDPELDRHPDWDNDALTGYSYQIYPQPLMKRIRHSIAIVRAKPSLIILAGFRSFDNLLVLLCALFLRIPVGLRSDNCSVEDRPPSLTRLVRKLALKNLLRVFSTVHPVGTLAEDYLVAHGIDRARVFRFPYLVDKQSLLAIYDRAFMNRASLRAEYGIQADAFVVLGVMKFVDREDPLTLLHAFTQLKDAIGETNSRVHLILVGDGYLRSEIERSIQEKHLSCVHLPGYVNYNQLPVFFAIADILIHPARGESWGVTVNEALVCGLPTIAANTVGSARDLIRNGVEGFTFPVGDSQALAAILKVVISEPHLLSQMKSRCRSTEVLGRFSYEYVAGDLHKAMKWVSSADQLAN